MTDIIGHRGAAGLALENTMASFEAAVKAGVRRIEFDVHATADGVYVVCHDDNLQRIAGDKRRVKELSLVELQAVRLPDGSAVPALQAVLEYARDHRLAVVVEYKGGKDLGALCRQLDGFGDLDMVVASFNHGVLAAIRKLRPELQLYLGENHNPFEVLQKARSMDAAGIDLNYKLLNPLTYWWARYWKLDIMVYTVNRPIAGRLISLLYPKAAMCTDHPERFIQPDSAKHDWAV